jgi:hypothetical protein
LLTVYIAEPASLSSMKTVPAANELPLFVVVLLNAENVPTPARALVAPIRSSVSRIFLCLAVIAVDYFGRSRTGGGTATEDPSAGSEGPCPPFGRNPLTRTGDSVTNLARVGEREWWLRAALVLWDPRGVFGAMRRDGADERQEPASALAGLAGLFAVLSTPRFAGLLDDPEVDGWSVAVFAFIGGAVYAFVGYFVLGAALKLASGAPYRLARHVVAYSAAPLALGVLFLWPVRLAAHGSDLFREGGADDGADGAFFALVELGLALWSAGLLVAGARYAFRLTWARAAAVSVLPLTLVGLTVWLDRFQ